MKEFDKLWDYSDPEGTEKKFREVLKDLSPQSDLSSYLQLLTQIARTYSLRSLFTEAHALLDEIQKQLPEKYDVAHARYHLERGRAYNSANWGKSPESFEEFSRARKIAEQLKEENYALDAIHMQAIAKMYEPEVAIRLNEEGTLLAENSTDEKARGWLGPFYNNLGWSYFDRGDYEKALSIFLRSLKFRQEKGNPKPIFIAKWTVARALRALNRPDEAITIQLGLLEEMVKDDNPDGYVYEELGELYLAKNEEVHKMYFGFAYGLLSKDSWFAKNEAARLERMLQLSK